jgi:signal transduction histidine kinase
MEAAPASAGAVLEAFGRRVGYSLPPEIGFELSLEPGLPPVGVPGPALVAALDELVANALAALAGEGMLRIRAARSIGRDGVARVRISVEDDGAGMEAETLRRTRSVRFTAGIAGHKAAIGLALALRVSEAGGGRLLIASTRHRGTRVTLELPATS